METRPNIFDYAKKELSQDARICWFLACLNSKDEFYKRIGVEFVKFILKGSNENYENIKTDEIHVDGPHPQYYHMDVYAVICVKNKAIPIIFEDKTDTYLHGEQMKKYCETVNSRKDDKYLSDVKEHTNLQNLIWKENTRYIYFKTGYVPEWQIHDFKKKTKDIQNVDFREIYIDDIIGFLEDLTKTLSKEFPDRKEALIKDYIEHLLKKKKENEESNFPKWDKRLKSILGDKTKYHYDYQGWAVYNILEFKNYVEYNLRCDSYKETEGDAICFQQFRDDGKKFNRTESDLIKRKENAKIVRDICEKLVLELKSKHNIEIKMENNDGSSQNTLFRVPISENEKDVCEFLKDFIGEFVDRVKTDTELSRELDEVFYERTDIL